MHRVAISEEYRCDPMVIYETWPYELLYDANRVLDYIYALREVQRSRAEYAATQAQQTGRRKRSLR